MDLRNYQFLYAPFKSENQAHFRHQSDEMIRAVQSG